LPVDGVLTVVFLLQVSRTSEDESSYSSFYSSFLKTDEGNSSNEGRGETTDEMQWGSAPRPPMKRPDPTWLENINLTNELVYQYKVDARTLSDVLNADLYALKNANQVSLNVELELM
jgi:Period protein 2/3C-terminal region